MGFLQKSARIRELSTNPDVLPKLSGPARELAGILLRAYYFGWTYQLYLRLCGRQTEEGWNVLVMKVLQCGSILTLPQCELLFRLFSEQRVLPRPLVYREYFAEQLLAACRKFCREQPGEAEKTRIAYQALRAYCRDLPVGRAAAEALSGMNDQVRARPRQVWPA